MVAEVKLKEPRSLDVIKQEYANLIMTVGTLQYEINCKERDLSLYNQTLRDLNLEYVAAKNKADEQPKSVEAAQNA